MDRIGVDSWDKRLYDEVFDEQQKEGQQKGQEETGGKGERTDDEKEHTQRIHEQLINTKKVRTCLSRCLCCPWWNSSSKKERYFHGENQRWICMSWCAVCVVRFSWSVSFVAVSLCRQPLSRTSGPVASIYSRGRCVPAEDYKGRREVHGYVNNWNNWKVHLINACVCNSAVSAILRIDVSIDAYSGLESRISK